MNVLFSFATVRRMYLPPVLAGSVRFPRAFPPSAPNFRGRAPERNCLPWGIPRRLPYPARTVESGLLIGACLFAASGRVIEKIKNAAVKTAIIHYLSPSGLHSGHKKGGRYLAVAAPSG